MVYHRCTIKLAGHMPKAIKAPSESQVLIQAQGSIRTIQELKAGGNILDAHLQVYWQ
jgi:hypothetical protein